jgi:hypothetical protein
MKDQKIKSEVKRVQPAKAVEKEKVLSAKSAVKAGPIILPRRP